MISLSSSREAMLGNALVLVRTHLPEQSSTIASTCVACALKQPWAR